MKKKNVLLVLVAMVILVFFVGIKSLNDLLPGRTRILNAGQSSPVQAAPEAPAPVRSNRVLPSWCRDVSELNGDFYDSVENDGTGSVREFRIYAGADVSRYSLSYYYTYFADDSETHYIVDTSGWSGTWRLRVEGDQLLVDRFEPVPGEDQDGSRLGTGALIASYEVGLSDWTARQLSGERYEEEPTPVKESPQRQYVANSRSKIFHLTSCADVSNMSDENKVLLYTTREDMLAQGYTPCGHCEP